jgi:predicted nucleic acid-binding protein
MLGKIFLDSNLWVYRFADVGGTKAVAVETLLNQSDCVVSTQVLNETANVLLKKHRVPATTVKIFIEKILESAELYPIDEKTTFKALHLIENYSLSFYDALIVAAALDAGCARLATEDLQHGLTIEATLAVENPFTKTP